MATTPNMALPYPAGSDAVQVPTDIKALADKLDDLLTSRPVAASGVAQIVITAANTATSKAIVFPTGRFANAPAVTVSVTGSQQTNNVSVSGISSTGGTVWLAMPTTGTYNVYWIAVAQT